MKIKSHLKAGGGCCGGETNNNQNLIVVQANVGFSVFGNNNQSNTNGNENATYQN